MSFHLARPAVGPYPKDISLTKTKQPQAGTGRWAVCSKGWWLCVFVPYHLAPKVSQLPRTSSEMACVPLLFGPDDDEVPGMTVQTATEA